MSINAVNYPGCYAPAGCCKGHLNPQSKAIAEKLNDEISCKQAYVKVEFLQNTLNRHKELTVPEKAALEYMLIDAQRELAQLQQKLNAKYPS